MQSSNANHFISIGLNFGLLILCVYPTWKVISELEENDLVIEDLEVLEQMESNEEAVAPQPNKGEKGI